MMDLRIGLLGYWVGPREEASYVSFWNQTVVVLDGHLDNASCERAFVVVIWGCGLRVKKGLMIMKWTHGDFCFLFELSFELWICIGYLWWLALNFDFFAFLLFAHFILLFFFFCTCLFLRTVWSKGLGRCGWWKKDRLNGSVYGSKGCKGFWFDVMKGMEGRDYLCGAMKEGLSWQCPLNCEVDY